MKPTTRLTLFCLLQKAIFWPNRTHLSSFVNTSFSVIKHFVSIKYLERDFDFVKSFKMPCIACTAGISIVVMITVQLLEGSFTRKIFCSKGQLRERFWSPVTRKNRLSYTKVHLLENGKSVPRPWSQMPVFDAKTIFWNLRGPRMVHLLFLIFCKCRKTTNVTY